LTHRNVPGFHVYSGIRPCKIEVRGNDALFNRKHGFHDSGKTAHSFEVAKVRLDRTNDHWAGVWLTLTEDIANGLCLNGVTGDCAYEYIRMGRFNWYVL
jgi:hypothetical protein